MIPSWHVDPPTIWNRGDEYFIAFQKFPINDIEGYYIPTVNEYLVRAKSEEEAFENLRKQWLHMYTLHP